MNNRLAHLFAGVQARVYLNLELPESPYICTKRSSVAMLQVRWRAVAPAVRTAPYRAGKSDGTGRVPSKPFRGLLMAPLCRPLVVPGCRLFRPAAPTHELLKNPYRLQTAAMKTFVTETEPGTEHGNKTRHPDDIVCFMQDWLA